jgi:hypothetical protein
MRRSAQLTEQLVGMRTKICRNDNRAVGVPVNGELLNRPTWRATRRGSSRRCPRADRPILLPNHGATRTAARGRQAGLLRDADRSRHNGRQRLRWVEVVADVAQVARAAKNAPKSPGSSVATTGTTVNHTNADAAGKEPAT